jgi:hypothetical protein
MSALVPLSDVRLSDDLLALIGQHLTYDEACVEACCMEDQYPNWNDNPIMCYHKNAYVYKKKLNGFLDKMNQMNQINWIGRKLLISSNGDLSGFQIYLLDNIEQKELHKILTSCDIKVSKPVEMPSYLLSYSCYNLHELIKDIENAKTKKNISEAPEAHTPELPESPEAPEAHTPEAPEAPEAHPQIGRIAIVAPVLKFTDLELFLFSIVNHDEVIRDLEEFISYISKNYICFQRPGPGYELVLFDIDNIDNFFMELSSLQLTYN